jgi:ubiquinone/menaquinone biosynthesis C-methylase UbiE
MSKIDKSNWDERFSADDYVYGTDPNQFLKEQLDILKPRKLLMLAEGEGRNAVYAAKMGWQVDAVDFSDQARRKALKLAEKENVNINYAVCNLNDYLPEENHYDAIGIIFVHLDKPEIDKIFTYAQSALKKGGVIICEVFSQNQLGKSSGGPKDPALLYNSDEIASVFSGLETIILSESTIILDEGILHQGEASVIRYVGKK